MRQAYDYWQDQPDSYHRAKRTEPEESALPGRGLARQIPGVPRRHTSYLSFTTRRATRSARRGAHETSDKPSFFLRTADSCVRAGPLRDQVELPYWKDAFYSSPHDTRGALRTRAQTPHPRGSCHHRPSDAFVAGRLAFTRPRTAKAPLQRHLSTSGTTNLDTRCPALRYERLPLASKQHFNGITASHISAIRAP